MITKREVAKNKKGGNTSPFLFVFLNVITEPDRF